LQVNNTKYACYRVMVKFNSTNSTSVRNAMFAAVAFDAASPCTGGYNQLAYKNVAALWAQGPFQVSQNCEFAGKPHNEHRMSLKRSSRIQRLPQKRWLE
jgi:hypothetical protein